ncbi:MAG TPA: alpha/beta fold hydrolase, partial [Longimicrobiaceae bacterium]|nr:alpha/beta fold hydrolase [Longimicrobiaceae bacterium]
MHRRIRRLLLLAAALVTTSCAHTPPSAPPAREPVTWSEIAGRPAPPAGERVAYGSGPQQFGELRLPEGPGPHPVVVLLHGGCWQNAYDLEYMAGAAEALRRAGFAAWTIEYRRIGDPGGAWTGTFQDAAAGTDHLRELARTRPLDLGRVVLAGHSAGGHLALWLAARRNLPAASPIRSADPLPVRGVVALAGIADLRTYAAGPGSCNAAVPQLMGGTPAAVSGRYAQANPQELFPLGVPVRLVQGDRDPTVPVAQATGFEAAARAAGDDARVVLLEGAGHFDVVAPFAPAWAEVE